MTKQMPGAAGDLADQPPSIWSAYSSFGKACAEASPLSARERRLVKLALAIGTNSEEAVPSHTHRARAKGIEDAALHQVALLAIGPLGLPRAVASKTWTEDQ
ncbi:carboxymuconolactone decarboxylase family protein [Roseovarius sp. LXJ103]|uniref:carboxymuconolactone decarboxylase family protein n=1 Tax=Roseovarius carneus TaxID=2853164 RepID=UPI000D62076D|nr:carboxymuconolactone decarboxylase family protein [Roseovarius carneus]MBZ8118807.1 carboxymuconolactone decarboxylase family protein [Roseovarius carneus]PWE35521.1 carboxymuconolactone decarboxylase [Pelagicola sp. LXJ1103]